MRAITTYSAGILVVAATALTGCVSGTARDGARMLAVHTTKVAEDGDRFAAARLKLARARQGLVQRLEESALVAEQENERAARVFMTAGDKLRAGLYADVREATTKTEAQQQAFAELRGAHEAAIAGSTTAVKIRTEKLSAAAKSLGQLAKPANWNDEVAFYLAFLQQVATSLDDASEQAKTSTDNGTKTVDTKTTELQTNRP